jgi:hypothetical protein
MNENQQKLLTRRAFARKAVLISASAALITDASQLPSSAKAISPAQLPAELPTLSPEGQAEADARYQLVLSRHGSRLNEDDKRNIRTLCFFVQPGLERLRSFTLRNGDVPALFLKPIVEREKPPQSSHLVTPPNATPKHS